MTGDTLYDVVSFILNRATEAELEVIRAALKRRIEGNDVRGAMGINPERLAHETAAKIQEQLGGSIEQMRDMVKRFAAEVIHKEAPELTEEQLSTLLEAWVPGGAEEEGGAPSSPRESEAASDAPAPKPEGPGERSTVEGRLPAGSGGAPAASEIAAGAARRGGKQLPAEALLAMVAQFVTYSTDAMSVREQIKLRDQIPDWQRRYWERFPPRVRQLINLLLKEEIDVDSFWERVRAEL